MLVLELVKEVRAHRITMGSEIASAAPLDVNIVELVQKICGKRQKIRLSVK